MKLNKIIKALEKSKFECVAGYLENHASFIALKEMANSHTVCCMGINHKCMLNVNNGYCVAQECIYQVREK